ncbi:MAG: transcription elongation factor GreA [Actinobacteria bacterium]|nr:transcription elongation factor GreA [Actinomycetota bacterium]
MAPDLSAAAGPDRLGAASLPGIFRAPNGTRNHRQRDFGDISENAEYDAAKNEQAMLEARIAHLEEKLRSASIVDEKNIEKDIVGVGTTVHLKDQKTDKSSKFKIVGSSEADPAAGKLSNESPIGKALIGHKRNDVVKIPVPRGPARQLKITKIEA